MGEFSSQNARLLDYLQTHEGITTAEAFDLFGITRLSARIWDLRDAGHKINGYPKSAKNRYGQTVTFYVYKLEDEE